MSIVYATKKMNFIMIFTHILLLILRVLTDQTLHITGVHQQVGDKCPNISQIFSPDGYSISSGQTETESETDPASGLQ